MDRTGEERERERESERERERARERERERESERERERETRNDAEISSRCLASEGLTADFHVLTSLARARSAIFPAAI